MNVTETQILGGSRVPNSPHTPFWLRYCLKMTQNNLVCTKVKNDGEIHDEQLRKITRNSKNNSI